jgi:hypothetical protein
LHSLGDPAAYQNVTPLDGPRAVADVVRRRHALLCLRSPAAPKTCGHARPRPAGRDRAITTFKDGRLLWPSISRDGKTIRVRAQLRIWTVGRRRRDAARSEDRPPRRGDRRRRPSACGRTTQFSDLSLSPDGRKVAFVARGDFLRGLVERTPATATRVTATADPRIAAGVVARQPEARLRLGSRDRTAVVRL